MVTTIVLHITNFLPDLKANSSGKMKLSIFNTSLQVQKQTSNILILVRTYGYVTNPTIYKKSKLKKIVCNILTSSILTQLLLSAFKQYINDGQQWPKSF